MMEGHLWHIGLLRFMYSDGGSFMAYRVLRFMHSDGGSFRAYRVFMFMYSDGGSFMAYRVFIKKITRLYKSWY